MPLAPLGPGVASNAIICRTTSDLLRKGRQDFKPVRPRVAAVALALLMVLVVLQSLDARATLPNTGSGEFNHALVVNGGRATASGSSSRYVPSNAIDGSTATYWKCSTTTGWLAVSFSPRAYINEVHIHFLSTTFPSLSLYLDTNANGLYEAGEKVWYTTNNKALDIVVGTATSHALGMKVTIDQRVGSKLPKMGEFEAYLRNDTDGDGLTNDQEAAVTYYQDARAGGLPQRISNAGADTVAFLNMGTTTSEGKVQDLSGNENHALPWETTTTSGRLGLGRYFDGYNDYLEVPDSNTLDLAGSITVAMWVYLRTNPDCDGNNNWRVLLAKRSSAGSDLGTYFIFLEENRLPSFSVASGGQLIRLFPTSGQVPLGAWVHLAFSRVASTGTVSYYLNGAPIQSVTLAPGPIDASTGPLRIGGGVNPGCPNHDGFFAGTLDEVQVWGRALAASEVASHFQRMAPLLYFDMESLRGSSMQDLSGNGNVATIVGTAVAEGRLGAARLFAGSDYLQANPTGSLTGSFTVGAWVKPEDPLAPITFVGTRGPSEFGFDIKFQGGAAIHGDVGDGGRWLTTAADAPFAYRVGVWYHVAYVVTSTAWTIYVNGSQVGTGGYATPGIPLLYDGSHRVFVGRYGGSCCGGEFFRGFVDEVYIYNQALAPAQVRDIYAALGRGPAGVEVGLAQFGGSALRALALFTVDHPVRTDLTAAAGYWNGSAWVDRYVWDPGRKVSTGPGAAAQEGEEVAVAEVAVLVPMAWSPKPP